jgi:hypothetical protein
MVAMSTPTTYRVLVLKDGAVYQVGPGMTLALNEEAEPMGFESLETAQGVADEMHDRGFPLFMIQPGPFLTEFELRARDAAKERWASSSPRERSRIVDMRGPRGPLIPS